MAVVQGTGPIPAKTATCDFCGKVFIDEYKGERRPGQTACCGLDACRKERDRLRKIEEANGAFEDKTDSQLTWRDRLSKYDYGETIAEFNAKVNGGRFMANGGCQITLNLNSINKAKALDVTDFHGVTLHITVRRLTAEEANGKQ